MNNEKNNKDHFSPSIGLAIFDRLGTKLYSKIETSLAETIANSYDANAKKAEIYYDSNDNKFIAILDNGTGMTRKQMQEDFMSIGKSVKSEEEIKYNRTKMGAKGIGKLAPLFYCKYYDIFSKTNEGVVGIRFTNDEKYLAKKENEEFKELTYRKYGFKNDLLKDIDRGTLIIPKELKKKLPFSKDKVDTFVDTMKSIFCFPPNLLFSIKLIDISGINKPKSLTGSYLKPKYNKSQETVFNIQATKNIDFSSFKNNHKNFTFNNNSVSWLNGKITGFFMVQESIAGLKNEERPKIKIYSKGRLVASDFPMKFSNIRTIGVNYVSGTVIMDNILADNDVDNDIISESREDIQWYNDDDERIIDLKDFLEIKIKESIKIFQSNSENKKNLEKKDKKNEAIKNINKIKDIMKKSYSKMDKETIGSINEAFKKIEPNPTIFMNKNPTLIISHSSNVGDKANFILNFLLSLGLKEINPEVEILNTSHEIYGLKYGEDFIERLNKILANEVKVTSIFCLSKDFFNSWFTPFEAGSVFSLPKGGSEEGIFYTFTKNDKDDINSMRPPFNQSKTLPMMDDIFKAIEEYKDSLKLDDEKLYIINENLNVKYFIEMVSKVAQRFNLEKNESKLLTLFTKFISENNVLPSDWPGMNKKDNLKVKSP